MRLWPTTVLTPDDWIAELRFSDGTRSRIGISPHLSEEQALERVRQLVVWRNKTRRLVDCSLRRRYHAFGSVDEMHPENRGRLVK
jgi:hypothetical protein